MCMLLYVIVAQRVISRRITSGVAPSVGSQRSGMRTWIAPRWRRPVGCPVGSGRRRLV